MDQKATMQLVVKPHIDEDVLRPIEEKLAELNEAIEHAIALMREVESMRCLVKVSLDVYPKDTSVENPQ